MSGSNNRIQHVRLLASPLPGHAPFKEDVLGCIKVSYDTQREAQHAPVGKGMRAYKCRLCRKWHHTHLTTEPPQPR